MSDNDPITSGDELVFAIDLTTAELSQTAAEVGAHAADEQREPAAPALPAPPPVAVRRVALLIDGWDYPLLLPIEPTRDVVLLDALARLLRIAILAGERVPAIAVEYGEELERRLVFERRLPEWVYTGVDGESASRLPVELRRVLGPKKG